MPQWHPEQLTRGKLYEFCIDDLEELTIERGKFVKVLFVDRVLCVKYRCDKGKCWCVPVVNILAVREPRKGKAE